MKTSATKLEELKTILGMEQVPSEEFIQFAYDVIDSMPDQWKDPMTRAYFQNGGQYFNEETGKPLRTDSRYHIMTEHSRRAFRTLVTLARTHKRTLEWLLSL